MTRPYVIEVWCDGACSGNPGPGGWAAMLVAPDPATGRVLKQIPLSGGEKLTTNNRMELQAVIGGLSALQHPSTVTVHVDSTYVLKAFTEGWLVSWKDKGWKNSKKQPVSNRDLWELLDAQVARHQVHRWVKVKGHAGVELNEAVDRLAVAACQAAARR